MLNGNYLLADTSRSADTVNNIASALNENVVTAGTFSLNPANNPTFSVSGRDPLSKPNGVFAFTSNDNVSNGGNVVVEVAVGLDGLALVRDSLNVYAQLYNSATGQVVGDKIYPLGSLPLADDKKPSKSGTSYKFVVPLSTSAGFVIGQNYVFGVDGTDQNGNPVVASGAGWGFHLASSGAAPDLVVTSPDPNEEKVLCKGSDLRVTGYTAAEEGIPVVNVYLGNTLVATPNLTLIDGYYNFDITLSPDKFSQDTTRTYNLKVTSEAEGKAEEKISVIYDVAPPVIKTLKISSPKITTHGDKNGVPNVINKVTTFEASITDSKGIKEITYEVYQYDDAGQKITRKNGDLNSFISSNDNTSCDLSVQLDTEDFDIENNKSLIFEIATKDIAGNVTTENNKLECYVYQKSDEPVYKSTSSVFDASIDSEEEISDKNKFAKTGSSPNLGAELPLSVSDDDGIKTASVNIYKKADYESDPKGEPYSTYNSIANINLPQEVGVYVVVIDITDEADKSFPSKAIYVKVTGNNPEVEITGIPSYVKTGDEFTVLLKITDEGKGPYKVTASDGSALPNLNIIQNTDPRYESGKIIYEHKITADRTKEQKYKVTDEDGTGLSTTKVATYKLDDSKPTIKTKPTPPTVTDTEGTSFTFTGKAEDTGSGVSKVEVAFDSEHTTVYTASGKEDWNYKARFDELGLTEGENKIYIRAIDEVSNEGDWVDVDFVYDTASPKITYTNKPTQLSSGTYVLKGVITENYGIKNNKIKLKETVTNDDGSNTKEKEIDVIPVTGTNTYNWEVTIPLTGHETTSGKFTYKFEVKDNADKELDENDTFSINRDLIPPEVKLTTPNNNSYGENSVNDTETLIKGTITEESPNKLYYKLYKKGASEPTSYTEVDLSAYSGTNQIWSFSVTGLTEGEWTFKYYADDVSGNESTPASQNFMVDISNPSITYKVYWIKESDNEEIEVIGSDVAITSKVTDETAKTFILKGKVTDSNGIKSLKVNDADVNPDSDGNWEFKPTVPTSQTTYNFEIETEDKSGNGATIDGKKTKLSRKVMFDKTKPTVTITGLENDLDWLQGSGNTYISGNANDNESGLQTIKIQIDGSPEKELPLADTWTDKINVDTLDENTENASSFHTIKLTVKDNADLETILERKFKLDRSIPVVETFTETRTHINKTVSGKNTNKVEFSGQVYDGDLTSYRSIKSAYLVATKKDTDGVYKLYDLNTAVSVDSNKPETYGIELTGISDTQDATFGTFTKEIALTGTNDLLIEGNYKFKVVGYDISGRECNSQELSLVVDFTNPVVETPALTWNDSPAAGIPHKQASASLDISSKITETNLDTVYYYINDGSDTTKVETSLADSEWNVISGSKTISFADGNGTIWIKAVDKAGNIGYNTSATYIVDTQAPDFVELDKVDGQPLSGNKLINGNNKVVFTVTAKDFDNGYTNGTVNGNKADRVAAVQLTYLGSAALTGTNIIDGSLTDATNGVWTIEIPSEKFANYESGTLKVKVTATDKAGNSKEYDMFSMELDKTAPTVAISTPSAASLNGTQTITGTVTEKNPKAISLYYRTDAPSANTAPTESSSGWTLYKKVTTDIGESDTTTTYGASVSDIYYWSFTNVDMNALSTASTSADTGYNHDIYWLAYAEDSAGNFSVVGDGTNHYTKKYTVDMDADRPVIQIMNNVTLKNGDNLMSETYRAGITSQTLTVNVSDDDGIDTFKYKVDAVDKSGNVTEGIWKDAEASGSSYKIELSSDGKKNVYFEIKDKAGTTFTSTKTNTYVLATPKLTDETNKYGYFGEATQDTVIYAKIDTESPSVKPIEFLLTDSTGAAVAGYDWSDKVSATTFGGKQCYLKLRQYAKDVNGIEKATVDGLSVTFEKTGVKTIGGEEYEEWTSGLIDISSKESGITTFTLEVSDGVNKTPTPFMLNIDNTPPEVGIADPAPAVDTKTVYSSVVTRGSTEPTATLYYTVSLDGVNAPSKGQKVTSWTGYAYDNDTGLRTDKPNQTIANPQNVPEYQLVKGSGLSWNIYFDGAADEALRSHSQKLRNYLVDFNVTSLEDLDKQEGAFSDIIYMYLWIKAVDEVGNTKEYPFPIYLDPQGDRPNVSIEYPEEPVGDSIASLGGTIKLFGSADDNEAVHSAWVQLVSDTHKTISVAKVEKSEDVTDEVDTTHSFGSYNSSTKAFTVTKDDLDFWAKSGYTVKKMNNPTVEWKGDGTDTDTEYGKFGIEATFSGSTWSLKINKFREFNPASSVTSKKANIAMRVYAYDGTYLSIPAVRQFVIDNESPYISDVKLKQTSTGAVKAYANGICVKGPWNFTFNANDNQEVKDIIVEIDGVDVSTTATKTGSGQLVTVSIPLDTGARESVGLINLKITLDDGNNKSPYEYSVKYDNNAPRIASANHANYALKAKVQQSNGFFTLKSFVTDSYNGKSPSGIDSVAFYFLRRGTGTAKVFDPMQVRTGDTDITSAGNISGTESHGDIVYSEGLFWKAQTISAVTNSTLTVSGVLDSNIHAGGICKIGGSNYKITKIEGNDVTLNEEVDNATTAYFALALVVDNTVSEYAKDEKLSDGYYAAPGNDDGDRMIEVMDGTSVEANWEAQIVSRNMTDGPVEIHYVAFDKAGNYSIGIVGNKDWATYKTYTTAEAKDVATKTPETSSLGNFVYTYKKGDEAYISNNAPRIVGVKIGTNFDNSKDASGKPTFTDNEYITRYYSSMDGKPTDVISHYIVSSKPDQSMAKNGYGIYKLKSDSEFTPEIIGGNNEMYYQWSITAPASADAAYVEAPDVSSINDWSSTTANESCKWVDSGSDAYDDYLDVYGYIDVANKRVSAPIVFTEEQLKNQKSTTVDKPTWFTIRIWDHTDETTPFVDSQYTTLQIAVANMVKDTTPPNISVDPFYWKNQNDNSLYQNSYKNGHIDLSKDVAGAVYDEDTKSYTTYMNPDVSGTVTFRGTVLDEHKVGSIWAKIGSATAGYITCINSVEDAASNGYYCVAKREADNTWTTVSDAAGTNWDFKFDDSKAEFTVDGELLYWELSIDTSVLGHADNVRLEMMARDGTYGTQVDGAAAPNAEHQSLSVNHSYVETVPTANIKNGQAVYNAKDYNVPYYDVDLVPYIGGVLDANGNEVDRSRLGKYNVQAGQTIMLKGFNFGSAPSIYRNKTADKGATGAAGSSDILVTSTPTYNAADSTVSFKVPENSGYIRAVWGSLSTPNNTNKNAGYNISEGLILGAKNKTGTVDDGLSKANEAGTNFWTDDVYLSVWNVGESFNTSSGARWGRVEATPTAGKVTGEQTRDLPANRLFGVWAANNSSWQEIYPTTAAVQDSGSRVVNLYGGSSDAARDAPPSCIDMAFPKVAPGVTLKSTYNRPFYVMLDNAFNKNQVWSGLEVYRDRQGYAKKANGSEHSIDNNDYRTIMTEKFINPSMSVFYNPRADMNTYGPSLSQHTDEGTYFVYVTYYDIYSHCLKYATLMYAGYYDNTDYGKAKVLVSSTLGKGVSKGGMQIDGVSYTSNPDANIMIGRNSYKAWTGNGTTLYTDISSPVVGTQMYTLSMQASTDSITAIEPYLIYNDESFYRNSSYDESGKYAWANGDTIYYTSSTEISGNLSGLKDNNRTPDPDSVSGTSFKNWGSTYNRSTENDKYGKYAWSNGSTVLYTDNETVSIGDKLWIIDTVAYSLGSGNRGSRIMINSSEYTVNADKISLNNSYYYALSNGTNTYFVTEINPVQTTPLYELNKVGDATNKVTAFTSTVIKGTDDEDYSVEAGEWNDVVVDISTPASPKPVVAYYNKTARQLEIARGTGYAPAYSANGKNGGEWVNFALSRPTGSTNFGQYLSMEIDAENNLHIVAQDVTHNGALYYGYVPYSDYSNKSSGTLNVAWKVIDATSNSTQTELKLENPSDSGAAAKPIVTYRDNSKADLTRAIKVAYVTNAADVTDPNDYEWDSLYDPAFYQVGEYKINLSANVYDSKDKINKCSIGYSSTEFAVDFLRDEQ